MRVFGLAVLVPTCAVSFLICTGDTAIALAASFLFYLSAVLLYMYPSICVALLHPNPPRALLKINLLAGWTVFGWFKAYRWALAELHEQDANVLKRKD